MFWLKSCPKCGGDLYEDRDRFGAFIACIQCSRYLTDREGNELRGMTFLQPVFARETVESA